MVLLSRFTLGNGTHNQSQGKILQRFPEKDWDDAPFIEGIELVRLTVDFNQHRAIY